jgi:transcription antitermination protein NusB
MQTLNKKRQAREFCFQFFFHLQLPIFEELKNELKDDILSEEINKFKESTNVILEKTENTFILNLISSTLQNYEELISIVDKFSKNWKINRLAKVDLTILLLAISELKYFTETPVKVVLNEAIEIAKKFGNEDSSKFVNGLLDEYIKQGK